MKRIFYNESGEVVCVNYPHEKYLGGTFADDLEKPIYLEVDDTTKPLYSDENDLDNPIFESVDDESRPIKDLSGNVVMYEKKRIITGYHKKFIGYEKKQIISGYEQKELSLDDCKIPDSLKSYSMITVSEDLPDHEYTNQMIIDQGKVTVDEDKTATLMPPNIIKSKEIDFLNAEMEAESNKDSPDWQYLFQLSVQRDATTSRDTQSDEDKAYWYEKALSNLSRAEVEKPMIAQKLNEKIQELKAE